LIISPLEVDRLLVNIPAENDASQDGGSSGKAVTRIVGTVLKRYFRTRDASITSFHGVAIRSTDIQGDERLWTAILSGRVSDWVGEAAYIRTDGRHQRISLRQISSAEVAALSSRPRREREQQLSHRPPSWSRGSLPSGSAVSIVILTPSARA
jgi:hypothetical protein